MSSTETGRRAEAAAKVYLEMRGFKILEQNWRRPRAEVDIIAEKDGVIHFVEAKYRRDDAQGGGFDAITPTKLRQMRRGAEIWVEESKWRGEYVLSAIDISGRDFAIMGFVENVL
jgi:putative endonuclease